MLKTLRLAAALVLLALPSSAEIREIDWAALVDPVAYDFEDPLQSVGYDELILITDVLVLRDRLDSGLVSEDARPRLEMRLQASVEGLEEFGHDVDDLLAGIDTANSHRYAAARMGNPALDGTGIRLAGFVLPMDPDPDGTRIAYLVPEVGMCSHVPPPPPNQMIRMTLPDSYEPQSYYEFIEVSGELSLAPTNERLMVVDGLVDMETVFEMRVTEVAVPKANDWSGAPAAVTGQAPNAALREHEVLRQ